MTRVLPSGELAGVHRGHGELHLSGWLNSFSSVGWGTGLTEALHDVGGDPQVVGGVLPAGAVRAEVIDLFDEAHDADVAEGVWMCVLPHDARGGEPPVRFLDSGGAVVLELAAGEDASEETAVTVGWSVALAETPSEEDAARELAARRRDVFARSEVALVWPSGEPQTDVELGTHGGDDAGAVVSVELCGRNISVAVGISDTVEAAAYVLRDRFDGVLDFDLTRRERARHLASLEPLRLLGRWADRDVEFLAAGDGTRWVALCTGRRHRYVVVSGTGTLPLRLELEPFRG